MLNNSIAVNYTDFLLVFIVSVSETKICLMKWKERVKIILPTSYALSLSLQFLIYSWKLFLGKKSDNRRLNRWSFPTLYFQKKQGLSLLLTSEVDARRCLPWQTKNVTASQPHDQAAWHLVTAVCPCVEIRRKIKPKPYDYLEICSFTFFFFCYNFFLL